MSNQTDIDYKNNIFEHPELTRIVGEPTTAMLITLQAEIRDNAQAVPSVLGGGSHGHLGLVCSPAAYRALIPGVDAYARPINPGPLALIPDNLTQYQIAQARDEHAEATRVFREVLGVERAIIQQIVAAVEPKYLRALRQPGTHRLQRTIPEILEHLFETYGDVTPQDLRELTLRVETLSFAPSEPVDTIFAEIDDLASIAEIANSPITANQKINMAYILFQKTQVYKSALTRWDEKPSYDKDWDTFKLHFRTAYKSLRRTGALTIRDTLERDEVMNLVTDGVHQVLNAYRPPSPSPSQENSTPSDTPSLVGTDSVTQSVNSTVSDLTLQSLQKQMELMQNMMHQMSQMTAPSSNTRNSTRRSRNARAQQPRNQYQSKYCWTHGLCHHTSNDCRSKADGHKDDATIDNRMGGSNKNIAE